MEVCLPGRNDYTRTLFMKVLDRAIVGSNWNRIYPDTHMIHGCFTCSDHCPIILSTHHFSSDHKIYPFRFQNF